MTSSFPGPESESPHTSSSLVTKGLVWKMKSHCGELGANVDIKKAVTIGWGSSAEHQRNRRWNIYPEAWSKWWELALGQRTWQWRSQPDEPWWAGGKWICGEISKAGQDCDVEVNGKVHRLQQLKKPSSRESQDLLRKVTFTFIFQIWGYWHGTIQGREFQEMRFLASE